MATTPHIVRIEEIGTCVRQVIESLNAEAYLMNQRGFFVELPEEIQFEMLVVKEWEALESTDREISEGTEIQGGFSTENSQSTGGDSQTSSETKNSRATNIHNNSGISVDTFKGS